MPHRGRRRCRAGAPPAPSRPASGGHDRVGGEIAGAAEILQQGGAHERLDHERWARGERVMGQAPLAMACEACWAAARRGRSTRVPVSSTRWTRRRAQAGDGCGKSARQWPPRLSSRASAAVAISSATRAGSAAPPPRKASGCRCATAALEAGAVAHHAQRLAHQGRAATPRSGAGGSATGRGAGSGAGRRAGDAVGHEAPPSPPPRAASCWPGGWRRAGRSPPTSPQAHRPSTVLRPSRVHGDAAHVVVRRRPHRDRLDARDRCRRPGSARRCRGSAPRSPRPAPRGHRGRRGGRRRSAPPRRARRRRAARARRGPAPP